MFWAMSATYSLCLTVFQWLCCYSSWPACWQVLMFHTSCRCEVQCDWRRDHGDHDGCRFVIPDTSLGQHDWNDRHLCRDLSACSWTVVVCGMARSLTVTILEDSAFPVSEELHSTEWWVWKVSFPPADTLRQQNNQPEKTKARWRFRSRFVMWRFSVKPLIWLYSRDLKWALQTTGQSGLFMIYSRVLRKFERFRTVFKFTWNCPCFPKIIRISLEIIPGFFSK